MATGTPRAVRTGPTTASRIQSFVEKGEISIEMKIKNAEDGDVKSQFQLGIVYLNGDDGEHKNIPDALRYFKMAAEQNHPQALSNLGVMADGGIGMEKNEKMAQFYWLKAAQQGIPHAQFNLGLYHELGKGGLEKSSIKAVKFYEMAAARGYAKASTNLGVIYEEGRFEEVKDDIHKAIKYYQEAADKGNNPVAAFNLGCIYAEGRKGIRVNKEESDKYFQLAKDFKLEESVNKLRWKRWFEQNWYIMAGFIALMIQHVIIWLTLGLFWTVAALIFPLTFGIGIAVVTTRKKE